jgi:hypothetical protein
MADEEIVIAFPLWIVAYREVQGLPRDARCVLTAPHGSGRVLLILTHWEQAERFIRKQGMNDLVALSLANPADLAGLLQALAGTGVTHVRFDEHPGSLVLPIAGVTTAARRSSRQTATADETRPCLRMSRSLCQEAVNDFWTMPVPATAGQHDLPPLEARYRCDYCAQEHVLSLPQAAHVWPICPNCGKASYLRTP